MKIQLQTLKFILITILIAISFGCSNSNAEVYKWVDENGKVHFSDKPFDEKSKAVKMKRQPSELEIQQAKEKASKAIQLQRKLSEIHSEEAREEISAQQHREKKEKEISKECVQARQEMLILSRGHRTYTTNDKGEKYFLSDQEKNDMIANLGKAVSTYCPNDN